MKSQINVPLCSKLSTASTSHKIKPIALPAALRPFGRCCPSGFVSHRPVTPWPQKPVLSPTLSSASHFLAPASPTPGPAVSNHLPRSYSGHFLAHKFSLLERHLETFKGMSIVACQGGGVTHRACSVLTRDCHLIHSQQRNGAKMMPTVPPPCGCRVGGGKAGQELGGNARLMDCGGGGCRG